jgi:CheY-like chemotaxis protein
MGLIIKNNSLVILELVSVLILIAMNLISQPSIRLKVWDFLVLPIIAINATLVYFIVPEISTSVLIFLMLYPIGCIYIYGKRGAWISIGMLMIIIIGNFIPLNNGFVPLNYQFLTLFSLSYIIMIFASLAIFLILDGRIKDEIIKVGYYEKEISERDEFITKLSHKLRTSLSNITLINHLVHDSRMSTAKKELLDTLKMSTADLISNVNELVEISTPAIIDYKQSILCFNLGEALEETSDILETDKKLNQKIKIKGAEELDFHIIGDSSLLRSVLINLIKGIVDCGLNVGQLEIELSLDYQTQNIYGLKFSIGFVSEEITEIETAVSAMQKNAETNSSHLNLASRMLSLTSSRPEFITNGEEHAIYFLQDFSKDLTRKIIRSSSENKVIRIEREKSLQESTLLLVEDNAINQKIVLLSLDKVVKKIDVANNGKEALDMIGLKKYDAILMDIQMPVMDGITATKKIREIEVTSDVRIPIIAITANALSGDRDNCLAAGADEYLSKPFQVEDLVDRISALLHS